MVKRLLLISGSLLSLSSHAQKLVNSTERCWSGGVAGKHGCHYTFTVNFTAQVQYAEPDTLWLADKPYALTLKNKENAAGGNMTRTPVKNGMGYEIAISTHFDDQEDQHPHAPGEKELPKPALPPIKYNGFALLSYKNNGKQRYFTIAKIMTTYPHVSYP